MKIEEIITDSEYYSMQLACGYKLNDPIKKSINDPNKKSIDEVVFRRHDNIVKYTVPWVEKFIDNELCSRTILDVGCGSGSSTLAFSHYCDNIIGYDIKEEYGNGFNLRKQFFSKKNNLKYIYTHPDKLIESVIKDFRSSNIILFNAVLEHIMPSECLEYLHCIWSVMKPGDYFVFTETPNRLNYLDSHSTEKEFLHLLPDEIFLKYIKFQEKKGIHIRGAKNFIKSASDNFEKYQEDRQRFGLSISFHDISAAICEDMNDVVISDGYDDPIMGLFVYTLEDALLLKYFQEKQIDEPVGFARRVLSAILKKPEDDAERKVNREKNRARRELVYSRYNR